MIGAYAPERVDCMKAETGRTIGIAGAGVMGSSLAQIFAGRGYDVLIYDIGEEPLEKSRRLISLNQQTLVEQGELTADASGQLQKRLKFSCDMADFAPADFVLEAVVERMDIKHDFWGRLSKVVREDAILTSNTSGLSISEIAEAVKNPARFAGMHWVNPPHLVPLVEVIKGARTSDETARAVCDMAAAVGQKPVLVKKDVPGFILNRIQFSVLREAMYIVDNGIADIEDVDNVLKYGLGMRYAAIGPFETADLGGLDTFYNISCYLFADLSDAKSPSALLCDLAQNGHYGVKSKKGFYDYSGGRDEAAIRRRDRLFIKLAKCLYGNDSE